MALSEPPAACPTIDRIVGTTAIVRERSPDTPKHVRHCRRFQTFRPRAVAMPRPFSAAAICRCVSPRQLGASRMAGATLLLNASARPRGSRWRLCGSPYGRNGGKAAVRATTIPKSFSRRRIIPASASRRGAFHDVWPCADLKEVADKETRLQIQSWRTHRLASSPVPASNSNLATQKSAMPKCALVYAVFGIPRRRVFETRQRMWLFRASDELRRRGSNGLRGSARLASDVAV